MTKSGSVSVLADIIDDEEKAREILEIIQKSQDTEPGGTSIPGARLGGGTESTHTPPEGEEEPDDWTWEQIKETPFAYIAVWNLTDPIWWAIMLPTGVGAATAAQSVSAMVKSQAATNMGLPRSSTFGQLVRPEGRTLPGWSRGMSIREVMGAKQNPDFLEAWENWSSSRANRANVTRPQQSGGTYRFFRQINTPQGANRLSRVTRLNLPQRAATGMSETELLAAEQSDDVLNAFRKYYAGGGSRPNITQKTLQEILEASGKSTEEAARIASNASKPIGSPGTGTDPYGRSLTRNKEGAQPVIPGFGGGGGGPLVGQIGTGVGGTGFTAEQLAASGLKHAGGSEVGSAFNIAAHPETFGLWGRMGRGYAMEGGGLAGAARAGGSLGGSAALAALPLLAYEIPTTTLEYLSRGENLNPYFNAGPEHQRYSFDPIGYTVGNYLGGVGQAYEEGGGGIEGVGNALAKMPETSFNALTSYFRQTLPQSRRGNAEAASRAAFESSMQKSPTSTPGGALAYQWGSTPQSLGVDPGTWLLEQKTGGSSGWIGG